MVSKNSVTGVSTSRKYDIEEKTVSIYKLNSSTNKVEKISVKIPMFFIQNNNDNTQGYTELNSKNPNLNLSNNTSEANKTKWMQIIQEWKKNIQNLEKQQIIKL